MEAEKWMRLALSEAELAQQDVPVGAVIVKNGQMIASAHNERETDSHDPFAHAEILAMREASQILGTRRLTGCTLYVTLEPCPMCAGAMVMAGIDACVFAAFDDQMGCCGSVYDLPEDPHFNHRVQVTGGVLEEDARAKLSSFFATKRIHPSLE